MRRKSERNKSKSTAEKKTPEATPRKSRRTSRRRKRSTSQSSSEDSDDAPLKPAVVETKEPEITPPVEEPKKSESRSNSDEDKKEEQPIWKVKTTEAPSGEIQKLKICLQRPPTTPERTEKSPRRRRGKASSQSDDASLTPDEKPQRRKSRRGSPATQAEGSSLENSIIEEAEKDECLIVVKETNEVLLGKGKLDCSQTSQESENKECTQDSRAEIKPDESLIETKIEQDMEQESVPKKDENELQEQQNDQNKTNNKDIVQETPIVEQNEVTDVKKEPENIVQEEEVKEKIEKEDKEIVKTETEQVQEINSQEEQTETKSESITENQVAVVEKQEINDSSNAEITETQNSEKNAESEGKVEIPETPKSKKVSEQEEKVEKTETKNSKNISEPAEKIEKPETQSSKKVTEHEEKVVAPVTEDSKPVEQTVEEIPVPTTESPTELPVQEPKSELLEDSSQESESQVVEVQECEVAVEKQESEIESELQQVEVQEIEVQEIVVQEVVVQESVVQESVVQEVEVQESVVQQIELPQVEVQEVEVQESSPQPEQQKSEVQMVVQISEPSSEPQEENSVSSEVVTKEINIQETEMTELIAIDNSTKIDEIVQAEAKSEEEKSSSNEDENMTESPVEEKTVEITEFPEKPEVDCKPSSPESSTDIKMDEDISEKIVRQRSWGKYKAPLVENPITSKILSSFFPLLKMLKLEDIKLEVEEPVKESKIIKKEREVTIQQITSPKEDDSEREISNIGLNRKISIVNDEASKLQPPPSPAKNPVSSILFITNLVRPFTIKQLQELLSRTGKIIEDGFWTDKIKSKCYVQYETDEEAECTRNALHGVQWPTGNGKKLIIDFGTAESMATAKNAAAEPVAPKPPVPEKVVEKVPDFIKKEEPVEDDRWEKARAAAPIREWDLGKVPQDHRERSRSRDRNPSRSDRNEKRKPPRNESPSNGDHISQRKKKKEESEVKMMDDLFHKTKATPSIYWLPLSPEQIAKKQQQRLQRMAEHKRRMEESRRMERDFGRGGARSRRRPARFDGE